jgi:predicted type IV restriction endonuclease
MTGVDLAADNFAKLKADVADHIDAIRTEQDARFQLIDRLIVEVLGWERSEIATEPHTGSGYIDYLLRHKATNKFVIEAKRTGYELIASVIDRSTSFKLGGPALRPAKDGIDQAAQYCLETGVPFAALTNGIAWLAFRPIDTDGTPLLDGKAIVFPTLQ